MSMVCCVPDCKNGKEPQSLQGEKRVTFHNFPRGYGTKRQGDRKKWIAAIRQDNPWWIFYKEACICSEHFKDDDFNVVNNLVVLKNSAVPSVFKKPATNHLHQKAVQGPSNAVEAPSLATSEAGPEGGDHLLEDDDSSNEELESCSSREDSREKDSTFAGWKPNVIYRSVNLDSPLNLHCDHSYAENPIYMLEKEQIRVLEEEQIRMLEEEQNRVLEEEPICLVAEIKTEELDPLEPTEVFSEGEEEGDSGANNEWQHDQTSTEVDEGSFMFDPNEETQVFSGDEGSDDHTTEEQAGGSTYGETPRTETLFLAAVKAETDVEDVCRTCGVHQHRLVDIYGNEGKAKNLAKKINKHLPIKVSANDDLPLTMCTTCVDLLEACSLIRESSRLQDQLFRSNIKETYAFPVSEEGGLEEQVPSAATPPLVCKTSATVSTEGQSETEGGKPKQRRKSRKSKEGEDYTILSYADLEKRLLAKIEANERVEAAEVQPLVCGECGEAFEEESLCRVHEKHHQIKNMMLRHECKTCGEKFMTYYLLLKHKKANHSLKTKHMCEHCGKQFKRYDHLESHINYRHKSELPYMCHLCSKCFALFTDLKTHITNHDNKTCNLCDSTFQSYEQMKSHKYNVHRNCRKKFDKLPVECPICNFTLSCTNGLEIHILLAHPNSPLVNELNIKQRGKQYACTLCGSSYTTKHMLKIHMNTHTKEILYKCKFCDKTSYHKLNIHAHEKSHKTERPYACKICDMTFKRRHVLKIHIRSHTGEKPLKCHLCDSAFAQITDLKRHVARHTSGGPVRPPRRKVRCEGCGGSFTSTKRLQEHECRGGGGGEEQRILRRKIQVSK